MSSPEWPPEDSVNRITWAQFIERVKEQGVSLETTDKPVPGHEGPGQYLLRIHDGKEYVCSLPDPLPNGKMGVWVCEAACRHLGLSLRSLGLPVIM